MEVISAADEESKEAEAGVMDESPESAIGDWELLAEAEEAGVDDVKPRILQATVEFKQHNCTWIKSKYLNLLNQLGVDTRFFCLMQSEIGKVAM